jgi:hypothetical protein
MLLHVCRYIKVETRTIKGEEYSMSDMAALAKPVEFSPIKIEIGYGIADPGRTQTTVNDEYSYYLRHVWRPSISNSVTCLVMKISRLDPEISLFPSFVGLFHPADNNN